MRVAKRRIEPVQTVNSANTGKAVRKCGPASHPGLRIIKIDSRKQAFQSLFEHEGTSMIRRSLNASKFRRACHPDASRHLTGNTHMFHIHYGIVDLNSRIAAHKVVSTFGFKRQMQAKRLQKRRRPDASGQNEMGRIMLLLLTDRGPPLRRSHDTSCFGLNEPDPQGSGLFSNGLANGRRVERATLLMD